MSVTFSHPADVPVDRALAVHAVMHNVATKAHWDSIDEWVRWNSKQHVVSSILRIIEMNAPDTDLDAERAWWNAQITAIGVSH